jgi:aldehyde:ferredoxin oxidoreductase
VTKYDIGSLIFKYGLVLCGEDNAVHPYAGNILHVDLSTEKIWKEQLQKELVEKFLGGRGINAALLWELVEPGIDPLGPQNVLIFGTGALSGTFAPSSGRTTVTSKGVLTNLYLKSSVGGHWGPELKFAGYDHLVVHGAASRPVYLWIKDDLIEIRDAHSIWGKNIDAVYDEIAADVGEDRIEVAYIGIGGENLVRFASIMVGHNTAARGGIGTVMGSKNLKAIAVKGSKPVFVSNPVSYAEAVAKSIKELMSFPARKGLSQFGTAGLIPIRSEMGLLPTENFRKSSFEHAYKISGQLLSENGYLKNHYGCSACGTSCHRYTEIDRGKYKGSRSGGPEYETVASLGAGCSIDDTDAVLKASELCNRYGLDTISTGGVIQWAIECYEKGVLKDKDTLGLALRWGDGDALVEMVKRIAFRENIGDLLAEGVKIASERIGQESYKWAIHAKGLEQSRAEVRARKGYALALSVSTRGPDHLMSQVYAEDGTTPESRSLIEAITGSQEYANHLLIEKRGAITRWHEDYYAVSDSLGLCTFVTLSRGYLVDPLVSSRFYSCATGKEVSAESLLLVGQRIINLEKAFNVREGATRDDDTLPWRLLNEPISSGVYAGMRTTPTQLEQMKDEYYQLRGWQKKTGWPYLETLEKMGLGEIATQLSRSGRAPSRNTLLDGDYEL